MPEYLLETASSRGLDVHLNSTPYLLNEDHIISGMNQAIMLLNLSHTNTELLPLAAATILWIFFFYAIFDSFIQYVPHAVLVDY